MTMDEFDFDTENKINSAACMCAERGRRARMAFVGAEAYGAMLVRLGNKARWDLAAGGRLTLYTTAGPVDVEVKTSLYAAVVVEDHLGEPWIAT